MQIQTRVTAVVIAIAAMQSVTAMADQIVKIGVAAPLTGEIAHIGKDSENGVRLAIEDLNARKVMIGGQPTTFVLDSQDDAADPKTAVTVAQKLVDDRVAGVVGHQNSGTSIPASRVYNDAGIQMITESATNPVLTAQGYKTVFRMVANDVRQGTVIGTYMVKDLQGKRIAVVDDRTAYGQGLADEVAKAVKSAGGAVVDREYGTDKTTNWMAMLTTLKSHRPDGMVFVGQDTQAATFLKQARALGLKVPLIAGDSACTPQFIKLSGDSMSDNVYCTLAGVPKADMPQGAAFYKRFQDRFGSPVQLYAPYAYDAAIAMVTAMQAANSTDPKVYLAKLRADSVDGVTGHIQFDDKGDIRHGAITVRQYGQNVWNDKSVVR